MVRVDSTIVADDLSPPALSRFQLIRAITGAKTQRFFYGFISLARAYQCTAEREKSIQKVKEEIWFIQLNVFSVYGFKKAYTFLFDICYRVNNVYSPNWYVLFSFSQKESLRISHEQYIFGKNYWHHFTQHSSIEFESETRHPWQRKGECRLIKNAEYFTQSRHGYFMRYFFLSTH